MSEHPDSERKISELSQENKILRKMNESLEKSNQKLAEEKERMEKSLTDSNRKISELSQENKILRKMNESLEKSNQKLAEEKERMDKNISESNHNRLELEQQKLFLSKSVQNEERKNLSLSKRNLLTIAGSIAAIGIIITGYSLFVVDLVGQEYRVRDLGELKSSYVIQNLKGDKVDTWLSWRLSDTILYVNILNAQNYPKQTEIVKDVVLSTEFYEIDDHLLGKAPKGTITKYYLGWKGALETAAQTTTKFPIPTNLVINDSTTGAGDVTISLANTLSGDGFAGITKSIADTSQNQILKSEITIYDVENLSENQLRAIVRHEFGHALGLAHSTAVEDLMHAELKSEYPYISHCDINALVELYDGSQKSEVVCEK